MKAKTFQRDSIMEMILKMRTKQPAEYEQLHPETKLLALEYESKKREAEAMRNAEEETRTNGNPASWAA